MYRSLWCAPIIAALLLCFTQLAVAQPPESVLRWVPNDANAVVVVNVRELNGSALGQREGWAKRHEMDFLAGAARIPPSVNLAVMATEFCFDSGAKSWEVGLFQLDRNVPFTDISRREGSVITIIGGERAIYSPRNAIFLELDRRVLGVRQPADRQDVTQWVQAVRANKPHDEFLTGLLRRTGPQPQVALCVDLREARGVEEIARALKNTEALAGMNTDGEALAKFLASAESLRLTVTVTNRMDGAIHLDFGQSPQPYANVLKPLLLGVLSRTEIFPEDVNSWQQTVQGNTLTLQGPLSDSGLRRLLSLIEPYLADLTEGDTPGDPKQVMTETSQHYFAVTTLLNDLRAQYGNVRTIDQSGAWFDRFAAKIDALPTLNVDPDLVQYALSLSSKMRTLSASLRGIPLTNNVLDQHRASQFAVIPPTFVGGHTGGWGGWGWGGWNRWGGWGNGWTSAYQPGSVWYTDNYREIWAKQRENVARGAMDRTEVWKLIDNETAAIRARMTQKYGVTF